MKNYDNYTQGWFNIEQGEFINLPMAWSYDRDSFVYNFHIINNKYPHLKIVDFTIRTIPLQYLRSKYDNARLLVIKKDNGEFLARRFNVNQWLPLDL